MRKLWLLVLMDSKSITRKISYYFLISAVVGAIFYSVRSYSNQNQYYFPSFQSNVYRWLLLLTAFTSSYYGAILTSKIRRIGVIEELIAIPVKRNTIIVGIFISRVFVVWVPIFAAFTIIGLWSKLIPSDFSTIASIGFCLLVFIALFTSVAYFLSYLFSTAFMPIVISFFFIIMFWFMASMFPYFGNAYLPIQQQIYKLNVGFNPFTFMYALGLSSFLYAPFIFMIFMALILLVLTRSVFNNSGWYPGDVQAKFRVNRIIVFRNLLIMIVLFPALTWALSRYIGFYALDTSDDQIASPTEAMIENSSEISVEFSSDNVDLLRYSIYFDKLARTSAKRVIWAPTTPSSWSGAILFNNVSDELCVDLGYLNSAKQERDWLALKLGRIISENVQEIECRPNVNQLGIFENTAISFGARKNSRRRVFVVGKGYSTGMELPDIVEQETFEIVIPQTLEALKSNIDYTRDILLITPLTDEEFSTDTTDELFRMINGGTAALIMLPDLPPVEDISDILERKLDNALGKHLEELDLEVKIGKFKYKDLDSVITDDNNVCCRTDYKIYAPWDAPDSTNLKVSVPIKFYSLFSQSPNWKSLLIACEDIQFESNKNHTVVLMSHNEDRHIIVTAIQNVQNRKTGLQYEISRNLIANALNICADKKLNDSETYNLIRRMKISSDMIFSNKNHSDIDMMLIITYIIWLSALLISLLRIIKEWRYLGAKI